MIAAASAADMSVSLFLSAAATGVHVVADNPLGSGGWTPYYRAEELVDLVLARLVPESGRPPADLGVLPKASSTLVLSDDSRVEEALGSTGCSRGRSCSTTTRRWSGA